MNNLKNIAYMPRWTLLFLLSAFVAGCGGGSAEPGNATGTQNSDSMASAIVNNANISSDKEMLSYHLAGRSGVISEAADAIVVTLPYGTDVTGLVANFITTGASVTAEKTMRRPTGRQTGRPTGKAKKVQVSGVTKNDFTHPVAYTVIAADGSTETYLVMVYVASASSDEIDTYSLAGVTGTIDPNTDSIAVTLPYGSDATALVATFTTTGSSIKVGTKSQMSSRTKNNFTAPVIYIVAAADGTTSYYTVTVSVAPQNAKAITAFSFSRYNEAQTFIDESAGNILVTLPYGLDEPSGIDMQNLVATFTTTGASVKVGATSQVSGKTVNDFTSPVNYIVTAADGTSVSYTVTVAKADITWKAINTFSFVEIPGAVVGMQEGGIIAVSVPFGTDVTEMIAAFTTTGNLVQVGATAQVSSATPNDFTNPVTYTVNAGDNTTENYTVIVTANPASVL